MTLKELQRDNFAKNENQICKIFRLVLKANTLLEDEEEFIFKTSKNYACLVFESASGKKVIEFYGLNNSERRLDEMESLIISETKKRGLTLLNNSYKKL